MTVNFKITFNKDTEQKINNLGEKLKKIESILEYPHSLLKRIIEIGIEENSLKEYKKRIERKISNLLLNFTISPTSYIH